MKMKKILFILCFFIMIFIPFNNVYAYSSENYDPGSNGDGLDTSSYSDYCNTTNGCVHNERGIRVTLVNNRGVQISGTHFVDFWDTVPINARAKSGTKYRSYYVNNSGNGLYGDGTTERGTYTSVVDATNDLSLVGGSISYSNQHELIEGVIREELAAYKISKNCSEFKFFEKFGYSNFCNDIKANDCDEKLSKIYVLIEPVYYVNYNKKNVVLTATELIAKIYKTRIIQGDTQKTYNLNKAAFDNAMTNMFLTSEDDKYEFYKSGKIKKKYNTFDQYAGDLQDINISEYYNSSTEHQEILKASIGLSSKYRPLGNSMHLVWLGVFSKDYCDTPKCCIPCTEDKQTCKEKFGENYNPDDPECCYADTIAIKGEDGQYVCKDESIYWKGKNKKLICCTPSESNRWCCDVPGFCDIHQEFCEEKCPPTDEKCPPGEIVPEFILGVCTEDDSETMSYFRDGVFNSENGLLKNYNTYEKLTTVGMGFLEKDDDENYTINKDILNMIATSDDDNTFQTVAKTGNSEYVTKINDYCSVTCQEIFDVTLPENKPVVNAGRYFRWHIKDSEFIIAKANGAKLCAVDIDLDKAIDEYIDLSQRAKLGALNAENFSCKKAGKHGMGGIYGSPAYRFWNECDDFETDYLAFKCFDGVDKNKEYTTGYVQNGPSDCPVVDKNTGKVVRYTQRYMPIDRIDSKEAIKKVYKGIDVYNYTKGGSCLPPPPIKDENYSYNISANYTGGFLPGQNYYPEEWCQASINWYNSTNFSEAVKHIYNSIKSCNLLGEKLQNEYEINMGVELNYSTLFNNYSYSTDAGNKDIVKHDNKTVIANNQGCFDGTTSCDTDYDNNGWIDSIFYLDPNVRRFHKNDFYIYDTSDSLKCTGGASWDIIKNPQLYNEPKDFKNPNKAKGLMYNPENLKMLCIQGYYVKGEYETGNVKENGEYISCDGFPGEYYEFTDKETGKSYWNTLYLALVGKETYYKLDDAINACICKEGYITNLVDDECICEREVSYYDFTSNYSNYKKLDDGTLTVEFMNGSGLYPISLKYWTLGSVSYHEGHFDSIATNIEYSKNVPPKICSEEGDKTVCTYGDPDGVCRYVIKNRIIAHPDDETDCDDEPCVPCEDESCGPEPPVTCIDDDGSINEECRDLAGLNVIYRVVDLNDPFPEGRSPGTNWIGNEGVITDNRGVSGMQLYSSSEVEPLYSFELTPAVIKEIRKDTANLEDQAKKYTVGTVVYQNGETTGGYSLFIHHTLSKYGTIKIDDDPSFNDTRFDKIKETRDNLSLGE